MGPRILNPRDLASFQKGDPNSLHSHCDLEPLARTFLPQFLHLSNRLWEGQRSQDIQACPPHGIVPEKRSLRSLLKPS